MNNAELKVFFWPKYQKVNIKPRTLVCVLFGHSQYCEKCIKREETSLISDGGDDLETASWRIAKGVDVQKQ